MAGASTDVSIQTVDITALVLQGLCWLLMEKNALVRGDYCSNDKKTTATKAKTKVHR